MRYIEHKFTLDVNQTASQVRISVKKGDTARRLLIHLTKSGYPYHMTKDCYAVFSATKPDGHVIFNNCTIEDCVIGYDFTAQTVAAVGLVNCEIIVYGAMGVQLTSASFDIVVEDSNFSVVESTSETGALASLIQEIKALRALGLRAPAVIGQAEGEEISLTDASDEAMQGLRIFGKTSLSGTPTPDNPAEFVSIKPVVTITDGTDVQTLDMNCAIPGLRVTSGGNYTDSNGQRWVCDEIDLGRGVYVQRIAQYQVSSVRETTINDTTNGIKWAYGVEVKDSALHTYMGKAVNYFLNNKFPMVEQASEDMESVGTIMSAYGHANYLEFRFRLMKSEYADKAAVEAAITGTVIYYLLAEPIETKLTAEEIAAFADLHSYKPNTTIYNDAGAFMAAEYVADTKTYVDRNGGSAGSAVRVSSVTLKAASWKGSANLYSQVVTIAGVTENSQVDLTPSVEQLAIFYEKDLTFVTENEDGVVTVYAIGQKPTNDYTIQVTITEVSA